MWKKMNDSSYPLEALREELLSRFEKPSSNPEMKRSHGDINPELFDFKYSPEGKEQRIRRFVPDYGWGSIMKSQPSVERKETMRWMDKNKT